MITSDKELVSSTPDGGTAADRQREYEELAMKTGVPEPPSPAGVIITGCATLLCLIGAWLSYASFTGPPGNQWPNMGALVPMFGCLLMAGIFAIVWLVLLGIWSIRRIEGANRKRQLKQMLAKDPDFAAFYEKWSAGKLAGKLGRTPDVQD